MDRPDDSQGPLDVAAAIRLLLDNRSLYLSLLREFQRHHHADSALLRAKLAAGDRRGGISVVHSLRGAARFICARHLELAAQDLERSLHADELGDLRSQLTAFGAALDAVLAAAELELRRPQ